jgi:transcription elongation factor Elf1
MIVPGVVKGLLCLVKRPRPSAYCYLRRRNRGILCIRIRTHQQECPKHDGPERNSNATRNLRGRSHARLDTDNLINVARYSVSCIAQRAGPKQRKLGFMNPLCPLCHTLDQTVTADSLAAGATWACTTCGQHWSAERLETVEAYAIYAAAVQADAAALVKHVPRADRLSQTR